MNRKSWCGKNNGSLLTFTATKFYDVWQSSAAMSATVRNKLSAELSQCFLCLYGHPNKKRRAKHLEDHGAEQVKNYTSEVPELC